MIFTKKRKNIFVLSISILGTFEKLVANFVGIFNHTTCNN